VAIGLNQVTTGNGGIVLQNPYSEYSIHLLRISHIWYIMFMAMILV